jgi:hypothetical protein
MSENANGTVFVVPIRFWEYDDPIETLTVEHITPDGFVYGFHHGYGHNVYIPRTNCCETLAACQAEIQRRRTVREAEQAAEVERIMACILATCSGPDQQA